MTAILARAGRLWCRAGLSGFRDPGLALECAGEGVECADAVAGGKVRDEEERRTKIRELAQSLLCKVSEEDRLLLVMKEVEGRTLKELEQIYNVSETALKVRLFRARQRVLKALEAENSPEV